MRPMTTAVKRVLGLALVFAVLSCAPMGKKMETPLAAVPDQPRAKLSLGQVNRGFEKNQGQTDKSVEFLLRGAGQTMFLTGDEAVMTLPIPSPEKGANLQRGPGPLPRATPTKTRMAVLRMKFDGAARTPRVTGERPLPSKVNYFVAGAGRTARTGIPVYGRVHYRALWPGIDAVFSLDGGRPRYDFAVAPGADPANIKLSFSGARKISVAGNGDLVIDTAAGEVRHTAPAIYQSVAGGTRRIEGRYAVSGTQVGFGLGDYDRTKPVIIHPVIFSSVVGQATETKLATGADGIVYMAGATGSATFPGPHQTELVDSYDAFVAKFDLNEPITSGAEVPIYVTYLGGGAWDQAESITVDAAGRLYVAGMTQSPDFLDLQAPALSPYIGYGGGDADGFVARLDGNGNPEVFTFLGGGDHDIAFGVAADGTGVYVTGQSFSTDFRTAPTGQTPVAPFYPFAPNAAGESASQSDAFIVKLDPDLSAVRYFSFLGGSRNDFAFAVAVHQGAAYVTGGTYSSNFRIHNAWQNCFNSGDRHDATCQVTSSNADVFVAKFKPEGIAQTDDALEFSTYLGGDRDDAGWEIGVNASGAAYVTGYSDGAPIAFPTTGNAAQSTHGDGTQDHEDAMLVKLTAGGDLLYSTFIGGTGRQYGRGIALDTAGNAYVLLQEYGATTYNFTPAQPATSCGFVGGDSDVFVAKFTSGAADPAAVALDWWCHVGGSDREYGFHIAVDGAGGIYVTGSTFSADFFTTPGATPPSGQGEAFLVKIGEAQPQPAGVNLRVTKSDSADPVQVGQSFTYTVDVTNLSSDEDATGVGFADTLPPGFVLDTSSLPLPPGCLSQTTGSGVEVRCPIGALPAGQSAQRTFAVKSTMAGTFENHVEVDGAEADPQLSNNEDDEKTTVIALSPVPVLVVQKSMQPPVAVIGRDFEYNLNVINAGDIPATDVELYDYIPNNKIVRILSATPSQGTCTPFSTGQAQAFRCIRGGPLQADLSWPVQIKARAIGLGSVVNTAFTWPIQSGGGGTGTMAQVTTTVVPAVTADLSVAIGSADTGSPSGTATFHVYAFNNTPGTSMPAINVSILLIGNQLEITDADLVSGGNVCAVFNDVSPRRVECSLAHLTGGNLAVFKIAVRSPTVPQPVNVDATISTNEGREQGPEPNTRTGTFTLN